MGNPGPFAAIPTLCLMSAALLVAGCSNSQEDVRVTLCKDIVSVQVGSSATILGTDTQTKGHEHAAVRVRFSAQGREAQAICYYDYDYDAVDDTALQLSDPLSVYATSPFKVVIDGQKLSKPGLAEAVKQAMLKQGSELVDRAKTGNRECISALTDLPAGWSGLLREFRKSCYILSILSYSGSLR